MHSFADMKSEISRSESIFLHALLCHAKFFRLAASKTYNVNYPIGLNVLTKQHLGFSHLREQKFKHNFNDILNRLCSCSIKTESITHYFLRCHFYNVKRTTLMNDLFPVLIDKNLTKLPLVICLVVIKIRVY